MVQEDIVSGTAAFSPCGRYRWWLERIWDPAAPRLLFLGLNPSRADAVRDDATLRRLRGFGRSWGFGALEVLNLHALVSPSPRLLRRATDPVGAENDAWILSRLRLAPATMWLGWGNAGAWGGRDRQVLYLLVQQGVVPQVLGITAAGHPLHPLSAPSRLTLRP
ncbi:MAG: DUF1643 domain-containing protein, partial [Synechococcus sp.]|nr:DUF1643 domain-containing protein [Synechococcus sp.]